DTARQAGAGDAAADCINNNTYTDAVAGMADATNVAHTPTVRINGQDYEQSTPDALVARINEILDTVQLPVNPPS
ncbi:MAG TPA: thioredoxin domain-containing protein, partial [Mycobacterium sp.]|nr:thioredoxin domain-containing protein [Mycobacterium sp.]